MSRLTVFNFVSLNGFFKGANDDVSWAHNSGDNEFAEESLTAGNILLFGRKTYEMMASFWPTPDAMKFAPRVAEGMNKANKIVFSRTLTNPKWENTRVISDNIIEQIKTMKHEYEHDMTLLGSGSIISQFASQRLIDEFQIMIHPVALDAGTPIFDGIKHRLDLKLTSTQAFKSGTVLLSYEPVEKAIASQ